MPRNHYLLSMDRFRLRAALLFCDRNKFAAIAVNGKYRVNPGGYSHAAMQFNSYL
jgi:hypothetical protein